MQLATAPDDRTKRAGGDLDVTDAEPTLQRRGLAGELQAQGADFLDIGEDGLVAGQADGLGHEVLAGDAARRQLLLNVEAHRGLAGRFAFDELLADAYPDHVLARGDRADPAKVRASNGPQSLKLGSRAQSHEIQSLQQG